MNLVKYIKYNKNRKITLEAWIFCMWYRFVIFHIPMKFLEKHLGVRDGESRMEVQ